MSVFDNAKEILINNKSVKSITTPNGILWEKSTMQHGFFYDIFFKKSDRDVSVNGDDEFIYGLSYPEVIVFKAEQEIEEFLLDTIDFEGKTYFQVGNPITSIYADENVYYILDLHAFTSAVENTLYGDILDISEGSYPLTFTHTTMPDTPEDDPVSYSFTKNVRINKPVNAVFKIEFDDDNNKYNNRPEMVEMEILDSTGESKGLIEISRNDDYVCVSDYPIYNESIENNYEPVPPALNGYLIDYIEHEEGVYTMHYATRKINHIVQIVWDDNNNAQHARPGLWFVIYQPDNSRFNISEANNWVLDAGKCPTHINGQPISNDNQLWQPVALMNYTASINTIINNNLIRTSITYTINQEIQRPVPS